MIPQPEVLEVARRTIWREQLRREQHRIFNRPMDQQTEENIRRYWKSIFELKEDWTDDENQTEPR